MSADKEQLILELVLEVKKKLWLLQQAVDVLIVELEEMAA